MDAEMRGEHRHDLRTLVWNKSSVTCTGRVRSCDCGSLGCRHRDNRAASSESLATVFMLRAVPDLAAGMTSFELPIPLP